MMSQINLKFILNSVQNITGIEHLDEIDSIATQLMNIFPRIEEIRVRWITKNNQGSIELESKDDRIKGWK